MSIFRCTRARPVGGREILQQRGVADSDVEVGGHGELGFLRGGDDPDEDPRVGPELGSNPRSGPHVEGTEPAHPFGRGAPDDLPEAVTIGVVLHDEHVAGRGDPLADRARLARSAWGSTRSSAVIRHTSAGHEGRSS